MPKCKSKARPYCSIINDCQTALCGRQRYQEEIFTKIYQKSPVRTGVNFQLELGETSRGFRVASFDLEPKENRYLLCSLDTSPYSISIFDTLGTLGASNYADFQSVFKLVSRCKRKNPTSITDFGTYTCIQWYPKDTGIFTTSSFHACNIQVWDTNRMKIAEEINVGVPIKYHDMSKTGIAALATRRGLRLVDLRTGSSIHKTAHNEENKERVNQIKWHPAQSSIVTAGYSDGKIRLWDVRSSKEPLPLLSRFKSEPVKNLLFCPNNRTLVSVHRDVLKIWDTFDIGRGERTILLGTTDERYHLADGPTNINCIAVSAKSNLIFIFKHCELFTYDLVKRKLHTHPSICQNISEVILDEYNPSRFLTLDEMGTLDVLSYNHKDGKMGERSPFDYKEDMFYDRDLFIANYSNPKTPVSIKPLQNKSKGVQETKKPDQKVRNEIQNVGENSHHVKESGNKSAKSKSKFSNSTKAEKDKPTQIETPIQSKVYEKKLAERKELWEKYLKESPILSRMLHSSTEEGFPDEWSSGED